MKLETIACDVFPDLTSGEFQRRKVDGIWGEP
jgi:hypothetical protein